MSIAFWIGVLGIPFMLLVINAIWRLHFGLPQSAGADIGMMFVAFDGTVLLQTEAFRKAVSYQPLAEALTPIFVLLLICDLPIWLILIEVERNLARYHSSRGHFPFWSMLLALLLPFLVVVLNLAPFTYSG